MVEDIKQEQAEDFPIKNTCLRLLSIREHSQHELRQKLILKGFAASAITAVLDDLFEQGWQSDERFAIAYLRYRAASGFGLQRIRYELRQRGIGTELIAKVLVENADEYIANIEEIYLKKYDAKREITKAEWLKRSRFLLQRGFSNTNISALFKHLQLKLT